jgi:uncharacterized Ntn-hydrolase superfamily protein
MTFSLIARDEETGRIGVAIASKFFAVGARCAFVRSGVGAVVTQAFFNPHYGPRGLALLAAGATAADAVRLMTTADDGRHLRQVHVMDAGGRFAGHTGNAGVLEAMAAAYRANAALPFARRLVAALQAGEAAGGDTRGRQSAALLVHDEEDYSLLDLRVDDHPDPLTELARLEEVARDSWVHFRRVLPGRHNPSGVLDRAECHARIAASIAEDYE